jgi:hypothetical protein
VTSPSFFGLSVGETFDIALPFCKPEALARNLFDVTVRGRLRPGLALSKVSAELASMSPGIMAATEIRGYDIGTTGVPQESSRAADLKPPLPIH